MKNKINAEILAQKDYFLNHYGKEQWVTVGENPRAWDGKSLWAFLINLEDIPSSMKDTMPDVQIGTQSYGFTETWGLDERTVVYEKNTGRFDHYAENIIHLRRFNDIIPTYYEVCEEFRFLNNLYQPANTSSYYSLDEEGESHEAVRFSDSSVAIKLSYLKRYISAKQMALILFQDTSLFWEKEEDEVDVPDLNEKESTDTYIYSIHTADVSPRKYCIFSGKKVILPNPVEQCGYYPYEKEKNYCDFIIGLDENGEEVRHTSNPDKLDVGENPNTPLYTEPVFFKKEVLSKYANSPSKYEIRDGCLDCKGFWSLRMDNNLDDLISVFLGDLGSELPENEAKYWQTYNILSDSKVSEVNHRRNFLGEWTDPMAPDLVFQQTFISFTDSWRKKFDWDLFSELTDKDSYNMKTLHIPYTNEQNELDSQVLMLTKVMIDSINVKALKSDLVAEVEKNERSISVLNKWLLEKSSEPKEVSKNIKYLSILQELRSKGSGHKKGPSYDKFIVKTFGVKVTNKQIFERFLGDAVEFLVFLGSQDFM